MRPPRASRVGWMGMLFVLVVLGALCVPPLADACAVCFGGEENDWTKGFVLGTIMMLSLPPAIVVGAGFTIYRSIKKHDAAEAAAEAAGAAAPTPVEG